MAVLPLVLSAVALLAAPLLDRGLRARPSTQGLAEGALQVFVGGLVLGLLAAEWLNGILRDFPGLPAAFDFFVWSPAAGWRALALLLVAGSLAGLLPAWRASSTPIARALREDAIG